MTNKTLWNKIEDFEIDEPDSVSPFSIRLAKENDWRYKFTLDCINEYKKFIYLATISKKPVSPSDSIDQVWHLHLIYSFSYWDQLCKGILNKEIHHQPTKGGISEANKHQDIYQYTLEIYYQEFKSRPPKNIWTSINSKKKSIDFKRINIKDYFLIPKKIIKWT